MFPSCHDKVLYTGAIVNSDFLKAAELTQKHKEKQKKDAEDRRGEREAKKYGRVAHNPLLQVGGSVLPCLFVGPC